MLSGWIAEFFRSIRWVRQPPYLAFVTYAPCVLHLGENAGDISLGKRNFVPGAHLSKDFPGSKALRMVRQNLDYSPSYIRRHIFARHCLDEHRRRKPKMFSIDDLASPLQSVKSLPHMLGLEGIPEPISN